MWSARYVKVVHLEASLVAIVQIFALLLVLQDNLYYPLPGNFSHMPPRKIPYRSGYKSEHAYTNKELLVPSHGDGPRCKVDYDPNNDGPLTTLQIMRIDDDDIETYSCAMPSYYAIPLILINKQLTFYEAQCHPDGTPLPASSSCGIKQRELREYSYLWNLRGRFLQAVYDMNHERLLNERWRYDGIHGFLHRMYNRFGHDTYQRLAYWREEIKGGRVPYTVPEIAKMDWEAYIREDMTTSTRINAFLWYRVSQGFSRVVKDNPPFESWRAWRAGYRDHRPVPYRTPNSSSVRELSSELNGVSATTVANCGAGGYDTRVRTATAPPPMLAAPAAATSTSSSSSASSTVTSSYSESAAAGLRRGVGGVVAGGATIGNGDRDVEEAEELEYEDPTVLRTTTLNHTGPPNSQELVYPFPSSSSELSLSQSSSGGTGRSMSTRTSSQGRRFRERKISFKVNAPEDMGLSVIQCTFARIEDVKNFETQLKVDYADNPS